VILACLNVFCGVLDDGHGRLFDVFAPGDGVAEIVEAVLQMRAPILLEHVVHLAVLHGPLPCLGALLWRIILVIVAIAVFRVRTCSCNKAQSLIRQNISVPVVKETELEITISQPHQQPFTYISRAGNFHHRVAKTSAGESFPG
jgi:hypothetical protein